MIYIQEKYLRFFVLEPKVRVRLIILFVIVYFGLRIYFTPFILSKIGAILCILSFVYYVIRMRNVKKIKPRYIISQKIELIERANNLSSVEMKKTKFSRVMNFAQTVIYKFCEKYARVVFEKEGFRVYRLKTLN